MKSYLVCYGTPSPRAVVIGKCETEPEIGKPCKLLDARMVLYWSGGGLYGLIADGPRQGSRITAAVPSYSVTPAEVGELTVEAAAKLAEYPEC